MCRRCLVVAVVLIAVVIAAPAGAQSSLWTERQRARVTPVVEVVERTRGAVVNISATHIVTETATVFDFFDVPRERRQNSVGSGSVIHPSGYILTNAHVVAQATELSVTTHTGKTWPAHAVAVIPEQDIAVIKAELPRGASLPRVVLGRSDDVMVGETVVAIGNPVGLSHTVTTGIISALDRELQPSARVKFTGVLQTDAAINPGNSGGPLLNLLGEQIGVNTAIRGDAQNVGFAIPVERVRGLLPKLLAVEARSSAQGGRLRLGLQLGAEDVQGRGVVIAGVAQGTSAARARILPGSVLVDVAGRPTRELVDALVALLEQPEARPFTVRVVLPEGSIDEITLQVEALPPPNGKALAEEHLGLGLADLDNTTAMRLGLRGGVVVRSVDPRGPAARVGIAPGDIVTRMGDYGVRRVTDLAILETVRTGDAIGLRVVRIDRRRVLSADVVVMAR